MAFVFLTKMAPSSVGQPTAVTFFTLYTQEGLMSFTVPSDNLLIYEEEIPLIYGIGIHDL